MEPKSQQPTSVVRIVAYVDGEICGEETCTVPAHLAEQVAVSALVQAEDPDLDLAWENWNNSTEEEERRERLARPGEDHTVTLTTLEKKLQAVADRLKADDGYRASVEYPGFLCVQMADAASLCMGFVNGPFGWNVLDASYRASDCGESKLTESSSVDALYACALAACIEVKATKSITIECVSCGHVNRPKDGEIAVCTCGALLSTDGGE